jgi:hypothetical protein
MTERKEIKKDRTPGPRNLIMQQNPITESTIQKMDEGKKLNKFFRCTNILGPIISGSSLAALIAYEKLTQQPASTEMIFATCSLFMTGIHIGIMSAYAKSVDMTKTSIIKKSLILGLGAASLISSSFALIPSTYYPSELQQIALATSQFFAIGSMFASGSSNQKID